MGNCRADELMLQRGLVESRSQARRLIMAGQVFDGDGHRIEKPAKFLRPDCPLTIRSLARYVSRGGDKLAGFFAQFAWRIAGCQVLDVGASTGGFSDYLLQSGAAGSVCVDVGHGQLHYRLRTDPRVTNFEGVNARRLGDYRLPRQHYDIITLDLSFISLRQVLPSVWPFLSPSGLLVALIKPQFEVSKVEADRWRGVIRDGALQERVRTELRNFSLQHLPSARVVAESACVMRGGDGNQEFFIGLVRAPGGIDLGSEVAR